MNLKVLGGSIVAFAVVGILVLQFRASRSPQAEHLHWRQTAVEPETKERPARFEEMKWHPNDPKPVEIRAPASTNPSHPKKHH